MANLYDKASLVLPTSPAYKDGAIQAYKPLTSQGTFDFSRGSNLAATRVDANGLIEKGRENLLLQSNRFDTTWYDSGISQLSNQEGYDGTNHAWKITRGSAFNYKAQDVTKSGVQTFSIYAKADSFNFILLRFQRASTSYGGRYFDLVNGTALGYDGSGVIDSSITSVGNGWYKISVTFNESLLRVLLYPVPTDNGVGAGGSGSVYIQDAQLEQGLVATDYIETGASTAQAGILEDMPRLDYSGGASCPSLLLEPQRSNLLTQSEFIGSSSWIKTRTTAIANQLISPDGNLNAYKLSETADSGLHALSINTSVVNGTTYNVSVFAKKGSSSFIQLLFGTNNVSGNPYVNFDLDAGTFQNNGISSVNIENYGNGWYRCSGTIVISGGTTLTYYLAKVNSLSATRASVFAGNVNNNIYIYGFQLEEGSYPTSYIPTYGSSVTRSGDSCSKTGISDLIGQSEGTLFAEVIATQEGYWYLSLSDGTNANWVFVGQDLPSTSQFRAYLRVGSVTYADIYSPTITEGVNKIAIGYKQNDVVFYVNGVQVGSDTSANMPSNLSNFYLSSSDAGGGAQGITGNIKQTLLFKTRLSNAELASLTTL
jgi:hypothetical protein